MHLRKEEITRHLSTIKLQCEVTRFLANNCLDTYNTSAPPTLFGNNEQRSRVAILVLISGEYLDQSLLLANRYRIVYICLCIRQLLSDYIIRQ